jgi:hypothetical protein
VKNRGKDRKKQGKGQEKTGAEKGTVGKYNKEKYQKNIMPKKE